jgi:hypothetical protein
MDNYVSDSFGVSNITYTSFKETSSYYADLAFSYRPLYLFIL